MANKITNYSRIGPSKRKGGMKRGVGKDTNFCCETATCYLNHFWACHLPIQVKRREHKPCSQTGSLKPSPSGHYLSLVSLAGMRAPRLDPKKSKWVVTTPSDLQAFTSLVGMQAPKLDPKKSKCEVMTLSGLSFHVTCGRASSQVRR